MSIYANGININMNEVCVLTFLENVNGQTAELVRVAVTYENLKAFRDGMSTVIEQYEDNLHMTKSDMGRAN